MSNLRLYILADFLRLRRRWFWLALPVGFGLFITPTVNAVFFKINILHWIVAPMMALGILLANISWGLILYVGWFQEIKQNSFAERSVWERMRGCLDWIKVTMLAGWFLFGFLGAGLILHRFSATNFDRFMRETSHSQHLP